MVQVTLALALVACGMLLAACWEAQAAKIVQMDVFPDSPSCTGDKATYSLFMDKKCQAYDVTAFGNGRGIKTSFKYDCDARALVVYPSVLNCTGNGMTLPFSCDGAGEMSSVENCAEYPDKDLVLMELGACSNNAISLSLELVLLVNTCLPMDSMLGVGYYKLTVDNDKTVTFTLYSSEDCTTGISMQYAAKLDGACSTNGQGRRLQASGVAFKSIVSTTPGQEPTSGGDGTTNQPGDTVGGTSTGAPTSGTGNSNNNNNLGSHASRTGFSTVIWFIAVLALSLAVLFN